MARISIDDIWFNDPRRTTFISIIGDQYKADGLAAAFWRLGQEAYKNNQLVNKKKFKMMPHWQDFVSCELAVEEDAGFYIKGSKRQFEWLLKRVRAGKSGGILSGESRRSNINSLAASKLKQTEANASKPNPITIPITTTTTIKEYNTNTLISEKPKRAPKPPASEFDFLRLYNLYPKKLGKQNGLRTASNTIKNLEQYQNLEKAIVKYSDYCLRNKTEVQFIKHFSTFMNSWEEWLDSDIGTGLDAKREQEKDLDRRLQEISDEHFRTKNSYT